MLISEISDSNVSPSMLLHFSKLSYFADIDIIFDEAESNGIPTIELSNGEWVAVNYASDWYVGDIKDNDQEKNMIKVNFMEGAQPGTLRWPSRKDEIWVEKSTVLCKISAPQKCTKSLRQFSLQPQDCEKIMHSFLC